MINKINQAVILCGGKGERLRPLTESTPKPLIRIDNRPFLEFLLEKISSQGIKRFVILSGYLGDQISDYFGSGAEWGIDIQYSHGPTEWDTAKRLWESRSLLDPEFLFLYSDNYIDLNLLKLEDHHYKFKKPLTLSLAKKKNGNIAIDEKSLVKKYDLYRSNASLDLVEIGFMIVNTSKVVSYYDNENSSFSKIIEKMTKDNKVSGFEYHSTYYSISDPGRLEITKEYLLKDKILILDRDGTLNIRPPKAQYIRSWTDFNWLPEAIDALKILSNEGFKFIVISNQAGIARKMVSDYEVKSINNRMRDELMKESIEILETYYCPHHWDEGCYCRKPNPGLFFKASSDHLFRIEKTLYIGDDSRDCQAAYNAGCNSIFVGDSNELKNINSKELPISDHSNLLEAVPDIINFYKTI
jgi:D-glycero-D-manno-heptose 1,7-bisphosphate phosphatase